ncbi:MAG: EAL domain-containing protein, partial [Halofilum sp. (in: g-proteobacteria)]
MPESCAEFILDALPEAIVALDGHGVVRHANSAAEKLFRYGPGTMGGLNADDLVRAWPRGRLRHGLARYLQSRRTRPSGRHRMEGIRRDGSRFALHLTLREIDGYDPPGYIADIGEHDAAGWRERADNNRVHEILEGTNASIWDWDLRTDELVLSERWGGFVGSPAHGPEHVQGKHWWERIHPDDRAGIERQLRRHESGRLDYFDAEFRVPHAEGGWVWLNMRGRIVERDDFGQPLRMTGTHLDVTQRKRAERALVHSEARYRSLIESVREVVFQTDASGRWSFLNSAWEEITGFEVEEALGRDALDQVHPYDQRVTRDEINEMLAGRKDAFRREIRFRARDGHFLWLEIHGQAALDGEGNFRGLSGTLRDVTKQREAEQETLRLVYYDALTGLPNRALALDRLAELLLGTERREDRVAVVFVDLDDFKKVNDTLGHEVGDQLLPEAGRRLASVVRKQDTVARLGGDEFLVLLAGLGRDQDTQLGLRKLLQCFHTPFSVDGRELTLTASLGIAIAPSDGDTPQDLLRNADMAMYKAKSEGRNTYRYFTEAMNREMARRFRIEGELRCALDRNEFRLLFQPLVDLETGAVVGAETLLRWHSAELGEIAPAEFIPIAEQTGLIASIGAHVAEHALEQAAHWIEQRDGRFFISINVSPQQFREPHFTAQLQNQLERSHVPPHALEVEITEGVLFRDREHAGQTLRVLRNLGIGIGMDDFGTGYASLSYLREYPFDTLKIDQSFVRDCTEDTNDRELVITSLRLASGLGLRAIAEGVETRAQANFLREQHCQMAQGHLFSPPITAEEFTQLIATGMPERILDGTST